MSWSNSDSELDKILARAISCPTIDAMADDAKARLREARLHSPIVRAVCDTVQARSHYELTVYRDDQLYAVMALELLRAHTKIMKEVSSIWALRMNPPVMMVHTCTRRHLSSTNWWQRFCLKLGGLA